MDVEALRRLIRAIQDGDAAATLAGVEARMVKDAGSIAAGAADLHYVRMVAFYTAGEFRDALAACELMLAAAERDQDVGWRARALANRADCRIVLGDNDLSEYDAEAVLHDLIEAEVLLAQGFDGAYLRGGVHLAVGICYFRLRLYELAEPHYLAAYELARSEEDDPSRQAVSATQLAELHLHWALELTRVGDPHAAAKHARVAESHALTGRTLAPSGAFWADLAELLAACAAAGGPSPRQAAERIRCCADRVLATGHRDYWLLAIPFLGLELARDGRPKEGLDVVAAAVAELPPEHDWLVTAALTHAHAILLAEVTESGAEEGVARPERDSGAQQRESGSRQGMSAVRAALEYGDTLAAALWRQRQRTLQNARTLRSYQRLRTEHEEVSRSAQTDPLTGIPNRRAFDHALARDAATTGQARVAVLVADLDRLKQLNDDRGHAAGDEALREVAAVLAGHVRDCDLVARVGGDEFYALLRGADLAAARGVAQRMVETVRALPSGVTVSIGVAGGEGQDVENTLHRADNAMYAAKRAGGNRATDTAR